MYLMYKSQDIRIRKWQRWARLALGERGMRKGCLFKWMHLQQSSCFWKSQGELYKASTGNCLSCLVKIGIKSILKILVLLQPTDGAARVRKEAWNVLVFCWTFTGCIWSRRRKVSEEIRRSFASLLHLADTFPFWKKKKRSYTSFPTIFIRTAPSIFIKTHSAVKSTGARIYASGRS